MCNTNIEYYKSLLKDFTMWPANDINGINDENKKSYRARKDDSGMGGSKITVKEEDCDPFTFNWTPGRGGRRRRRRTRRSRGSKKRRGTRRRSRRSRRHH